MALIEQDLFRGTVDKVQIAIDRIKTFEPEGGYQVAFSGGKDSQVIYDLVLKSGVKYIAIMNLTSVDPRQLLKFVKTHYPDVVLNKPPLSMFQLILKKGFPPTRKIRFCCDHLKERNSIRSFIITGIRWEESVKRGKRKIMETCFKNKRKHYVNPIIDWTKEDVWQYLRENDLPHCELYDPPYNYRRIGCVMCPMGGREGMLKDMRIFPKFANAYLTTFKKLAKLHPDWKDLNTGEELFNWWIRSKAKDNENNFLPFDN